MRFRCSVCVLAVYTAVLLGCGTSSTSNPGTSTPVRNSRLLVNIFDSNGDPVRGRQIYFEMNPGSIRDSVSTGALEIPGLLPGRYFICVSWYNEFLARTRRCDSIAVDVGDTPLSLIVDAVKRDRALIPSSGSAHIDTITSVKIVKPNY